MDALAAGCPVCTEAFDAATRQPVRLSHCCGVLICAVCLQLSVAINAATCPFCKTRIVSWLRKSGASAGDPRLLAALQQRDGNASAASAAPAPVDRVVAAPGELRDEYLREAKKLEAERLREEGRSLVAMLRRRASLLAGPADVRATASRLQSVIATLGGAFAEDASAWEAEVAAAMADAGASTARSTAPAATAPGGTGIAALLLKQRLGAGSGGTASAAAAAAAVGAGSAPEDRRAAAAAASRLHVITPAGSPQVKHAAAGGSASASLAAALLEKRRSVGGGISGGGADASFTTVIVDVDDEDDNEEVNIVDVAVAPAGGTAARAAGSGRAGGTSSASAAAASSHAAAPPLVSWRCGACTFSNAGSTRVCGACDRRRPGVAGKRQRLSPWDAAATMAASGAATTRSHGGALAPARAFSSGASVQGIEPRACGTALATVVLDDDADG
jgi:hypothetical protein